MAYEPPTEEVIEMKQRGMANNEIIEQLKNEGYAYEQISDALTQAEMKAQVEGMPPTPSPTRTTMRPSMMSGEDARSRQSTQQGMMQSAAPVMPSFAPAMPSLENDGYGRNIDERIEEIAEAIISEKWQKMTEDIGDINVWKEKVKTNILSMKQEIMRIENRFESLQKVIVGKVNEYDKNISDVGAEIKALEKLLQKIIQPLTTNVNELSRITEKLKK